MPTRFVLVLAVGAAFGGGVDALAFPDGPPAGVTGSPASGFLTCAICHSGPAGDGGVDLLGRPRRYAPGRVYTLSVRIADPAAVGAGFQMSVETPTGQTAGELILADPVSTQFASGDPRFVTHTYDGHELSEIAFALNPGWCEYPVLWRAPETDLGPVAFYLVGNAFNDDHTTLGDTIYQAAPVARFNACPADLNGDGSVDGADLAFILSQWDQPDADADLTGDRVVNTIDLATALQAWGPCTP